MSATYSGTTRTRPDRCPGVLRPWPAADGGLARIRVPGGRVATTALARLTEVARAYGDGRVHVTGRANLQLRGLPLVDGRLPEGVVEAVESTGLLPSRAHDLARNVLVSPLTGRRGGRADLRPVLARLDRLLLETAAATTLPGRFLFTLDDGRGDLASRHRDLGLVAVTADRAQLRVGRAWGRVVALADAPAALVDLAVLFIERRGAGPSAAWHVDELPDALVVPERAVRGAEVRSAPLPFGPVAGLPDSEHVLVGDGGIRPADAAAWASRTPEVVITPWRGVLV